MGRTKRKMKQHTEMDEYYKQLLEEKSFIYFFSRNAAYNRGTKEREGRTEEGTRGPTGNDESVCVQSGRPWTS